jgi:hypothetical protein
MVGRTERRKYRGKVYPRRAYLCSGYNVYGLAICHRNAVPEEALLCCVIRKVVAKLQNDFLNPVNVQALKDEIRRQEEDGLREQNSEAQGMELQAQIDALEDQISRGARRMITEVDDSLIPEIRRQLQTFKQQHAQISHRMAILRGIPRPAIGDVVKAVELAGAYVGRVQEALKAATPSELGMIVREIIDHVEMWFHHEQQGQKGIRCRFAEGLIYLRQDTAIIPTEL